MLAKGRARLAEKAPQESSGRLALHWQIGIGLVLGAMAGVIANLSFPRGPDGKMNETLDAVARNVAEPVGQVFLRLIFMIVVPMVFSALALGVVGIGDVRRLGRVGVRTLVFTLGFSLTAVAIGIALVNLIEPGASLPEAQREQLKAQYAAGAGEMVTKAKSAKSLRDTLLHIIPENPLQEMVGALDGSSKGNGMLSVMFFALVFGVALAVVPEGRRAGVVSVLEGVFDACMAIIHFAMRLAPIAVAGLVFAMTARLGVDILRTLFWFVLTVMIGLAVHLCVVYSCVVRVFGGRSPLAFFRDVSEAMLTAFATSSSNATLPTAIEVARERLRLRPEISNFVLTVGATGNQNGTALYEGIVVLFLAQVFGVELSLADQIKVVLMSVLAGVGTAGVPGGSIPLIVVLLRSVGVPGEGIAIILGVDRILDMSRTVLNVTGDLAVAACVDKSESR
jgi:DAACS family dicarboxylate/amino acid:cation (Na+ or H+) symporter